MGTLGGDLDFLLTKSKHSFTTPTLDQEALQPHAHPCHLPPSSTNSIQQPQASDHTFRFPLKKGLSRKPPCHQLGSTEELLLSSNPWPGARMPTQPGTSTHVYHGYGKHHLVPEVKHSMFRIQ